MTGKGESQDEPCLIKTSTSTKQRPCLQEKKREQKPLMEGGTWPGTN